MARDVWGFDRNWVMEEWLLLEEYEFKRVYIKNTENFVTDAMRRLYIDSTFTLNEDFFLGLVKNDYKHSQHLHMTMMLSQTFEDNT